MQEVIYRPGAQLRRPRQVIRSMVGNVRRAHHLAWRLFVRNLKAQYRQSLLGYLWLLIPPLVTAGVWIFLNGSQIISVAETGIPYAVFVLTGTVLWNGFVEALNSPLRHFSEARQMLTKVQVPSEAVVLAGMGEVLFNLAIRLVVVLAVCVALGFFPPWTALLSPLGMLPLLLLGIALGLLLTPFGLLYGDVQRGLSMVTMFWFFLTPVVYPLPTEGLIRLLGYINPATPLLVAARDLLTRGYVQTPLAAVLMTGLALVLLLAGWLLFRLSLPHIIIRMGNR